MYKKCNKIHDSKVTLSVFHVHHTYDTDISITCLKYLFEEARILNNKVSDRCRQNETFWSKPIFQYSRPNEVR